MVWCSVVVVGGKVKGPLLKVRDRLGTASPTVLGKQMRVRIGCGFLNWGAQTVFDQTREMT